MREGILILAAVLSVVLFGCNIYAVVHFYLAIKRKKTNGPTLALVLWFLTGANEHVFLAVVFALAFWHLFALYSTPMWLWGVAVLALHLFTFVLLFWEFKTPDDRH